MYTAHAFELKDQTMQKTKDFVSQFHKVLESMKSHPLTKISPQLLAFESVALHVLTTHPSQYAKATHHQTTILFHSTAILNPSSEGEDDVIHFHTLFFLYVQYQELLQAAITHYVLAHTNVHQHHQTAPKYLHVYKKINPLCQYENLDEIDLAILRPLSPIPNPASLNQEAMSNFFVQKPYLQYFVNNQ